MKQFETFRNIGSYEESNLTQKEPSCFNKEVRVERYRITVEPIVESTEIYAERLQKLWDECDNMHHLEPLRTTAKRLGVTLIGSAGDKRRRH